MGEILKEWLRENLLLFKKPEEYRQVMAVRAIVLVVSLCAGTAVVLIFQGKIEFDISFILGIFAIFISWLFFWSSERTSQNQMKQLQDFVKDFRTESLKGIDTIKERVDRAFKTPPPEMPLEEPSDAAEADSFYRGLSDAMEEGAKQILIALNTLEQPVRLSTGTSFSYLFREGYGPTEARVRASSLAEEFERAKLISFDRESDGFSLTPQGRKFATWLETGGQKAEYFGCPYLGVEWGTPPEGQRVASYFSGRSD